MESNNIPQLIKVDKRYKLIVESSLENKIRFLCSKLPSNEWSGTLFYTITGTFENNDLTVHCKDFMLQDVGTSTFTSFEHKANTMAFMVDNDLIDSYLGLMHSHNSMMSNPSGTDINTVNKEGNDMPHFVSLIVNNAGVYHACITRKITYTNSFKGTKNIVYNTFEGKKIKSSMPIDNNETNTVIEYYPLDITIEQDTFSDLENQVNELLESPTSYINHDKQTTIVQPPIELDTLSNRKKNAETKQTSLYDDNSFNISTNIEIPSGLIEDHIKQLITGSVFSHYNKNLNIYKWVDNMVSVYSKRFNAIELFQAFADWFLEYLVMEVEAPYSNNKNDCAKAIITWAENMVDALGEFPSNVYLDYYIEVLNSYYL